METRKRSHRATVATLAPRGEAGCAPVLRVVPVCHSRASCPVGATGSRRDGECLACFSERQACATISRAFGVQDGRVR